MTSVPMLRSKTLTSVKESHASYKTTHGTLPCLGGHGVFGQGTSSDRGAETIKARTWHCYVTAD